MTAGVGINAEGGEFLEIVKKMVFQGKPWDKETRTHLIKELGDTMWYVAQACIALGVPFDEVIQTNIDKLMKRYPGGNFDPQYALRWTMGGGSGNSTTSANTNATRLAAVVTANSLPTGLNTALPAYFNAGGPIGELFSGSAGLNTIFNTSRNAMQQAGKYYTLPAYDKTFTGFDMLPPALQQLGTVTTQGGQLFFYFIEGLNETIAALYAVIKKRQYALEQIGHGDYNRFVPPNKNYDRRFVMETGQYI